MTYGLGKPLQVTGCIRCYSAGFACGLAQIGELPGGRGWGDSRQQRRVRCGHDDAGLAGCAVGFVTQLQGGAPVEQGLQLSPLALGGPELSHVSLVTGQPLF